MKRNSFFVLVSLFALVASACNSSPKKKSKKSSSSLTSETSSTTSSNSSGVAPTTVSPTTADTSSSIEPISSSDTPTSVVPTTSTVPTTSVVPSTSVAPTTAQPSSIPVPSSSSTTTAPTPSSSSITTVPVPPSSSTTTPVPPSTSSIPPLPGGYYDTISDSDTGSILKEKLRQIITNGHVKLSYNSLADCMTITDRDWEKSPNESDTNPYMHCIYLADNENNPYKRSQYPNYWDKEHIWAKSNGSFNDDSYYSYSDLHHLRASDRNNNGSRSNYCFNNISSGSGNYVKDGNGDNSGILVSGSCYMPQACDRGDVARALFYMATRYGTGDGTNPYYPLELRNENSNNNTDGWWGHLDVLLQWHEQDPVDEFERHRNDLIFERYQYNRNPFIDNPNWAYKIWGS